MTRASPSGALRQLAMPRHCVPAPPGPFPASAAPSRCHPAAMKIKKAWPPAGEPHRGRIRVNGTRPCHSSPTLAHACRRAGDVFVLPSPWPCRRADPTRRPAPCGRQAGPGPRRCRGRRFEPLVETIPRRPENPECSSARAPISLSSASRQWIRCTPAVTSRSSSPSIALPIPRCRHAAARLTRITQARSPVTVATVTPTSSSPTAATSAGSCDRTAAIRSDSPNAGASLSPPGCPTTAVPRRGQ